MCLKMCEWYINIIDQQLELINKHQELKIAWKIVLKWEKKTRIHQKNSSKD